MDEKELNVEKLKVYWVLLRRKRRFKLLITWWRKRIIPTPCSLVTWQ
jgi:hypothetical protein